MALPSAVNDRLAELAGSQALPVGATDQLGALLELLAADDRAPTTVREPARAVDVHVADSLTGLQVEEVRRARAIADLGAGAGFPGIVLAAALPESSVALVESVARKGAFLERAVAATGVQNARVVVARAEGWPDGLGRHDLVTARALAGLPVLVEYAAPLLAPAGALVAWKGRRDPGEEGDGDAAAAELGLERRAVHPVRPFPGVESRHLYVYLKVRSTPDRFPRREGMARKRPLRGSGRG